MCTPKYKYTTVMQQTKKKCGGSQTLFVHPLSEVSTWKNRGYASMIP